MILSYWEIKSWLANINFTVVGIDIVGLTCALHLKHQFPEANILILEKGLLPQGASAKNADFTCFGSVSEILDDLTNHTEEDVISLVRKRVEGLQLLRQTLGDTNIDYQQLVGYELFTNNDSLFEKCLSKKDRINQLLKPLFKAEVFSLKDNVFNFKNIKKQYIFYAFEGLIDTGKMMETLLQKAYYNGIKILNNVTVERF